MNISEALAAEIKRNIDLLEEYNKIPSGVFGATVIKQRLHFAIDALASGDVAKIVLSLVDIQESE